MPEILPIEEQPVWKARIKVWVNGDLVNTYFKPDFPQPQIEAKETMIRIGASWNTDSPAFDLIASPSSMTATWRGTVNGDTVKREITVVQV